MLRLLVPVIYYMSRTCVERGHAEESCDVNTSAGLLDFERWWSSFFFKCADGIVFHKKTIEFLLVLLAFLKCPFQSFI